jgi:hypothetical protein
MTPALLSWLRRPSQGLQLCFEILVILALDLELGLEFLDQQVEARDFGAKLEDVAGGRRLGLRWRLHVTGMRSGMVGRGGRRGRVRW